LTNDEWHSSFVKGPLTIVKTLSSIDKSRLLRGKTAFLPPKRHFRQDTLAFRTFPEVPDEQSV
jgi:hypothetical protein